jgi:hypothetical protein
MERTQPPDGDAVIDGVVAEAHRDELAARDDAVLLCGESSDALGPCV